METSQQEQEKKAMFASRKMLSIGMLALTIGAVTFVSINSDSTNSRFLRSHLDNATKLLHNNKLHRELQSQEDDRKLIWLLDYNRLFSNEFVTKIHQLTGRSTATNIGYFRLDDDGVQHKAHHDSIPVVEHEPSPSYIADLPPPDKYVLTQTQGYGACYDCHPEQFMGFISYGRFMQTYNHANKIENDEVKSFTYDEDLVDKILILLKNPVDVPLLRFYQKRTFEEKKNNSEFLEKYSNDRWGFRDWCHDQDNGPWLNDEIFWYIHDGLWDLIKNLPCRSEFIKIFTFYNRARELAVSLKLDMLAVRYEELDVSSTAPPLLDFLEMDLVTEVPEKDVEYNTGNHITEAEYEMVRNLFRQTLYPFYQEEFEFYWHKEMWYNFMTVEEYQMSIERQKAL